jgi:hypothetical protein
MAIEKPLTYKGKEDKKAQTNEKNMVIFICLV